MMSQIKELTAMQKNNNPSKEQRRYFSPLDVWGMAFGCMVGWGVFAMPGTTFLPVAGPLGTMIAFFLGVIIILVIGYNFSYLMGRSAMTGGVYSYAKEAFGRDHAFLSSWFLCLSYLTIVFLNGTALFIVIRTLFKDALKGDFHYTVAGNEIYFQEAAVSVISLVLIGVLFIAAKRLLRRLHTALAVILLLGIAVTAVICLPRVFSGDSWLAFGAGDISAGYGIFSVVILAPWAFVGFEMTSFDTVHFNFAMRKTKWVIVIAILAAGFAYCSMALVSIASVPDGFSSWQEYILGLSNLSGVDSVPTFNAARDIMGTPGLVIMTVTAIAAILTGIIGGYRATTRVLSTMAEDHILSEKFSKTSYSILFIMALAILFALLGRNTLNWFVDLTSFGAIVGFGYTSASAYKIARSEENRKAKIMGVIGTVISVMFAIVQLVPKLAAMEAMGSEAFLLLSLWCLLGFVFYWRTITRSTLTEYSGMSTSGVVLFALLVYSALMWLAKRLMSSESVAQMQSTLTVGGIILIVIIFVGLAVMLYIQNIVRKKHEAAEREKIHAVESSLAKSRFLFNMSHDIRTPMNAIIGYTNLALKEPTSDKVHGYLMKIDGSGQHLLSLINDILEMSRIESGRMELELSPVDLSGLFNGIRDLFEEQMKSKSVDFSVHTGQMHHPYVWCDRKNLNRALLNILGNAYKFTPEGGTISVSVWEAASGEDGYGNYEIRVRDSGIGMSKEFAEKMFSAFERERSSTVSGIEGTGLGLAITKSIVDMMGGTIEVLTSPGSGTEMILRFMFRFSSAEELHMAEETFESDSPTQELDLSKKRLLLAEDNAINLEIAMMLLTGEGFIVETAANGKEAVDMVAASAPGYYDAVLMDIQMPVMGGYEATAAIRALDDPVLASVPIIAMTANAFAEDVEAAKNAGMQAHIAKPIDVKVMLSTITSVLSDQHHS